REAGRGGEVAPIPPRTRRRVELDRRIESVVSNQKELPSMSGWQHDSRRNDGDNDGRDGGQNASHNGGQNGGPSGGVSGEGTLPEWRSFLNRLEGDGELKRVSRPVEADYELPAILKELN